MAKAFDGEKVVKGEGFDFKFLKETAKGFNDLGVLKKKIALVGRKKEQIVEDFILALESITEKSEEEVKVLGWENRRIANLYNAYVDLEQEKEMAILFPLKEKEKEEKVEDAHASVPSPSKEKEDSGGEPKKDEKVEKRNVRKGKGPGVIMTILDLIRKNGPIDKGQILEILVKSFPDREENKMKKTVNAQIGGKKRPTRMEREKGLEFIIDEGKYSIK